MRRIVVDTNCLLMMIPRQSPYRKVWDAFLRGTIVFCVSNEILEEYHELLSQKVALSIVDNVLSLMLTQRNLELIVPYYRFGLIQSDVDDNKFEDCAIAANADYLVSNDKHFRILQGIPFPKVNVVCLNDFSKQFVL